MAQEHGRRRGTPLDHEAGRPTPSTSTAQAKPRTGKYYLYVIGLDQAVLAKRKFRTANPGYRDGKPCYYVGTSIYRPAERFKKHKAGERSSAWVRQFGLYVAKKKCRVRWTSVHGPREEVEACYAAELRTKGYGIWQK
jgi:hypothetical protein